MTGLRASSVRTLAAPFVLAAVLGCGPTTTEAAGSGTTAAQEGGTMAPITDEPTEGLVEEEVSFEAAGATVYGTLARPEGAGKHAAVLLIAGSGPTDRDWNNPLMPGTNGSAKLLAQELANHGVVTLRYDKRGTGATAAPETVTMADYLAEQQGALDLLRGRDFVDPARVFVAGHSEGAIHALRLAASAEGQVAGVILLSGPAKSLGDTMVRQVTEQFAGAVAAGAVDQATADGENERFRLAIGDVAAGNPVAPEHRPAIPALDQLLQAVEASAALGLRELVTFDPSAAVAALRVPLLIVNGDKDLQVRPDIDAQALADAARAGGVSSVELAIIPNADHVYKRQELPLEQLGPEAGASYNAPDRILEPALVTTLIEWLQAR
jgi:pimeloyl-ACP methyl ester carboxylesterase